MRIRTKAVLAFAAVALGVSGVSAAAMAAAPAQGGPTANLDLHNQITDTQTVSSGSGSFSHWIDCPFGGAAITGTGQAYNITDSAFDNVEYSVSSSQKVDADTWKVTYSLQVSETYHIVSMATCLNVS